MEDKLIMEIFVTIDSKEMSQLDCHNMSVLMIPFSGTVSGDIFNGIVLPGGVDTQVVNVNGVRHMSARYMMDGVDNTGTKCKIYVENNGYFSKDTPMPFKTVPTFYTDSKALEPYLHCRKFRGEGHPDENGVVIKMYEVVSK